MQSSKKDFFFTTANVFTHFGKGETTFETFESFMSCRIGTALMQ
jgi:hypothetical protein